MNTQLILETITILIGMVIVIYTCFLIILLYKLIFKYETKELIRTYINIQYGVFFIDHRDSQSESFYQLLLQESTPFITNETKILDVGCALGRLTFEYEKMGVIDCVGIDNSKVFINFCKKIQKGVPNLNFETQTNSNCIFIHGDFLDKKTIRNKSFDFISCINVFDRVTDPTLLIHKLYSTLNPDGILLITTPYDWDILSTPKKFHIQNMKEVTKKYNWEIKKEVTNIPYTIPVDKKYITLYCHLLILKKR